MATILIIDDDESIVDALSLVFDYAGYTICAITQAAQVYEKIAECKPDVILLDILMSGSDGREICQELKKDTQTKNIPVIMISAHPSAAENAKEAGAEGFLAKPFDTDELLQVVKKHL